MEQLLHYVWKHKLFPLKELTTTDALPVEIIDPGLPNSDAGPDFFNAKIKIDGTLWVGNVEIHTYASDWFVHGHDKDKCYDSVILHVVENVDAVVLRTDGQTIPQMKLSCPDYVQKNYEELQATDRLPRCSGFIRSMPLLFVHSWLTALQTERLEQRSEQLKVRLNQCNGNWEDAFFVTLARNFGFGVNGDSFENWALQIPLRAVDKHRDNLLQVEAIFFGQAGLLEDVIDDSYYRQLQSEFSYLKQKFGFSVHNESNWKFLRMRPGNFPHVRIAQLAYLYHRTNGLLSQTIEAKNMTDLSLVLSTQTSVYWETHYHFHHESPKRVKALSTSSLPLIMINTIVPILFSYGRHKGDGLLCERAFLFLEQLKAEDNHITRMWKEVGLKVVTAADSQALLQLKNTYCDARKCLYCRIGYSYLKKQSL